MAATKYAFQYQLQYGENDVRKPVSISVQANSYEDAVKAAQSEIRQYNKTYSDGTVRTANLLTDTGQKMVQSTAEGTTSSGQGVKSTQYVPEGTTAKLSSATLADAQNNPNPQNADSSGVKNDANNQNQNAKIPQEQLQLQPGETPEQYKQRIAQLRGEPVPQTQTQAPAPVTSSYSGPSIVDFLNSTGQASDFNSRASLAQKYGISNYTGTASQNTQLLNTLRGASTINPAQTGAPAFSGSSNIAPPAQQQDPTSLSPLEYAQQNYGVTFDENLFKTNPQQSIQSLVKDLMKATKLPDITSNIDNISSEIEDLANKRDDEIRAVNDDPWLTEGVRIDRVNKVNAKYEDRIKNKTAYLTLMQGAYDDARQQAQWVAQTALEQYDTQRRFQFDQLKYWTDQAEAQLKAQQEAQKQDYSGIKSVQNGLYDVASGTWLVPPKADSGGVDGMFNAAQINATVNQIAGAFDNEPVVKNFNILNEGYQFAQSLANRTTNPADDQALIYAFAKAMDPNSVVREGEYNTVQKYAQSWVKAYGASVQQAIAGTGFLSPSARENIKKTIGNRYNASLQNYQNVYNQYQQRIEAAKSGQGNSLTDYSQAFTQQPIQQQQSILDEATSAGVDIGGYEGFWGKVGALFGF